jgi:hypothetical protein
VVDYASSPRLTSDSFGTVCRFALKQSLLAAIVDDVSKIEGVPSFKLPLVLLSCPVNLLVFRDGGFRLFRRTQWIDLFIDESKSDAWALSASVAVLSCFIVQAFHEIHVRYESSNLQLIDHRELHRARRTGTIDVISILIYLWAWKERKNAELVCPSKEVR